MQQVITELRAEIAALKAAEPLQGPPGERGLSGEPGPQGPAGEAGPAGERGADGAAGPQGEPGQPGGVGERGEAGPQGERGEPGLAGKDGFNGAQGERGADGIGLAGAVINREGQLVVTLTDGAVHTLGPVLGKDGADGKDGKDGAPGKDGRDGFSLDDFTIERIDDRSFNFGFKQGEITKWSPLTFPIVLHRGSFKSGKEYLLGDQVTYGGSTWIARKDKPQSTPREGDDWDLASRRGRDGRDGKDGKNGERGPQGEPGIPHWQHGKT